MQFRVLTTQRLLKNSEKASYSHFWADSTPDSCVSENSILNRKFNKLNTVLVIFTCMVYHIVDNHTAVFTMEFCIMKLTTVVSILYDYEWTKLISESGWMYNLTITTVLEVVIRWLTRIWRHIVNDGETLQKKGDSSERSWTHVQI
jgi:hypothetical protein